MSVIFEGVDGVGKTTKALRLLHKEPRFRYIHNWAKPRTEINMLSEVTKELILLTSPIHIILDRSYIISEFVYSTILNRTTSITFEHVKELIDVINKQGHIINLMYYINIDALKFKSEDIDLPFNSLNEMYISLLTNELSINHLIITIIDNRGVKK